MRATIAICTVGRESLSGAAATALAQSHPDFEVLVVVDGDAPVDVPGARVIHQPHAYLNAARNRAMRESTGEFVAFLDDDEEAPSGWLVGLDAALSRHPEAACVGGPLLGPRLRCRHCAGRAEGTFDEGDAERSIAHIMGGNMAIRREAFEATGPFNEQVIEMLDDFEWQDRAKELGWGIVYVPTAPIAHLRTNAQRRLRWMCAKTFRRGRLEPRSLRVLNRPVPSRVEYLRRMARPLAHAVRYRCPSGLSIAASNLGSLTAA